MAGDDQFPSIHPSHMLDDIRNVAITCVNCGGVYDEFKQRNQLTHECLNMNPTLPRKLFDAVGDLALAINPHVLDSTKRAKVKKALVVLIDHIIEVGEERKDSP